MMATDLEAETAPKALELTDMSTSSVKAYIEAYSASQGLSGTTTTAIANCESGFYHKALNHTERERSRGVWQINEKAWPEVTDSLAFDPVWSTKWSLDHMKKGRWNMWTCYNIVTGQSP